MSHRLDLTYRLAEIPFQLSERDWSVRELAAHFDRAVNFVYRIWGLAGIFRRASRHKKYKTFV